MTYKEISKEFLDKANVTIGDTIKVTKEDISYEGILLDRSEDAKDAYIVIKLDSGYNVGVNIESANIELIEKGDKPKIGFEGDKIEKDPNKQNISIISTGGTVSSIIDYKTGAVHPKFTAEDLLRANPELLDLANYDVKALYNILSENMQPEYWVKAAESIADDINNGADGIVIAHGTDTMHYTSAALSFMIKTPVPIVITGAQRSSDRPSTDAFLNIYNSCGAALSDIAEVTVLMHNTLNDGDCALHNVLMHNTLNDGDCALHKGTKVRKMHTSRRDTFRSIDSEPIALLRDGKVKSVNLPYTKRGENELELNTAIESKVALIKSFPGISSDIIDYHIDKGYKGLLIEGTGLGHVPDYMVDALQRANDEDIPVVMTSQCLYGTINMNVYSTGRLLQDAGVISGMDMTPETAYVKLAWALGQTEDVNEVKDIIQTNVAGELNESSSLKYFLN